MRVPSSDQSSLVLTFEMIACRASDGGANTLDPMTYSRPYTQLMTSLKILCLPSAYKEFGRVLNLIIF